MVTNKQELLNLISSRKVDISALGIKRVGVFGSFSRGEQKQNSDVDLLIEFSKGKKTFRNFMGFVEFAQEAFGREVDVLTPESISPYLAPYITKEIEYVKTA